MILNNHLHSVKEKLDNILLNQSKKNKPNFFIVGAPKCGTSAMWSYLKQHPEIFMSEQKEIYNFFDTDLTYRIPVLTEEKYLRYFESASDEKIIGEATVFNLVSKQAAQKIKKFNSDAKIVIMLRNPIEMTYALYTEQVFNGNEPFSFEDALKAEQDRMEGKGIPEGVAFSEESLCYTYMALYSEQVKRYLVLFGKENIHVILFDDLKEDVEKVYQGVLSFLNVDITFKPEFKRVNPNQKIRNKWFNDYLRHLPNGIQLLSRILIPNKKLRKKLFHSIRNANAIEVERDPISSKIEAQLKVTFQKDVEQLSELLGISFEWVD